MEHDRMQGRDSDATAAPPMDNEGPLTIPLNPLALDIPDIELAETVDTRLEDIRNYYTNEYNLYEKRSDNELYYFGRHISEQEREHLMKDYESRASHNVLYEIESNLKPLAMSRLPDLIVTPGNDSEQSRLMATEVSKAVDTQIKSRQNRYVLGLGFKHRPIYYTGVIKAVWNNEKDDYEFLNIHPDMVDVDYTCPSNNADDMELISQIVPATVRQMMMRFPSKEAELKQELEKDGVFATDTGDFKYQDLATEVKYREVWFKWYKRISDKEFEPIWGVLWKYRDCIMAKMKNPNYDYEGEKQWFVYEDQPMSEVKRRRQPTSEELVMAAVTQMLTGQMPPDFKQEQIYHNYFDHPRMPFYFIGYDQWGKQPLDETTRVEQNLPNQKELDRRMKQVSETLDNRGHHIWSKLSGLKPSDIQQMDFNDPDEDAVVDGDVNVVHKYIEPPRPSESEFADQDRIEDRMHKLAGDTALQGQVTPDTPATTNQIAREANFTKANDEVEDTINAAAEWMAQWSLQFIKLRYTEEHFRKILGVAGSVVFLKLSRNSIEDGMQVMIKASGTDKLQAKNNAIDLAKLKMIEPVNFFRDMGFPDYQERAEMLMTFTMDPQTYMVKYVQNLQTSAEMAAALMQSPENEIQPGNPLQPGMVAPNAMPSQQMGGAAPAPGMPQTNPANPTPQNTSMIPQTPAGPPEGSPRLLG